MAVIEDLTYVNKVNSTLVFVENTTKLGLDQETKRMIVQREIEVTKQLLKRLVSGNTDQNTSNTLSSKVEESTKKAAEARIDKYEKLVLNHGLILICSAFDAYLRHALEQVISSNPPLREWLTKEEILQSYDGVNRQKRLHKFFSNKLGIPEEDFFDFSVYTKEIQDKYEGMNFGRLLTIFEDRDKAAHTDENVVSNYQHLEDTGDLFNKVMINLAFKLSEKWGTQSELLLTVNKYSSKKP